MNNNTYEIVPGKYSKSDNTYGTINGDLVQLAGGETVLKSLPDNTPGKMKEGTFIFPNKSGDDYNQRLQDIGLEPAFEGKRASIDYSKLAQNYIKSNQELLNKYSDNYDSVVKGPKMDKIDKTTWKYNTKELNNYMNEITAGKKLDSEEFVNSQTQQENSIPGFDGGGYYPSPVEADRLLKLSYRLDPTKAAELRYNLTRGKWKDESGKPYFNSYEDVEKHYLGFANKDTGKTSGVPNGYYPDPMQSDELYKLGSNLPPDLKKELQYNVSRGTWSNPNTDKWNFKNHQDVIDYYTKYNTTLSTPNRKVTTRADLLKGTVTPISVEEFNNKPVLETNSSVSNSGTNVPLSNPIVSNGSQSQGTTVEQSTVPALAQTSNGEATVTNTNKPDAFEEFMKRFDSGPSNNEVNLDDNFTKDYIRNKYLQILAGQAMNLKGQHYDPYFTNTENRLQRIDERPYIQSNQTNFSAQMKDLDSYSPTAQNAIKANAYANLMQSNSNIRGEIFNQNNQLYNQYLDRGQQIAQYNNSQMATARDLNDRVRANRQAFVQQGIQDWGKIQDLLYDQKRRNKEGQIANSMYKDLFSVYKYSQMGKAFDAYYKNKFNS